MVVHDSYIHKIISYFRKTYNCNDPILIIGENGTGKKHLAKALHAISQRNRFPFIPVNCKALPAIILETELFGFEEGVFKDVEGSKAGLMELANRGILFLENIDHLDLNLQYKMLDYLNLRTIRRIGGSKNIELDLMIMSCTTANLVELSNNDKFSKNLSERISRTVYELPPLRHRKNEINFLVDEFIKNYNKQIENTINGIEENAINALMEYEWPGNISQLKEVIETAMMISKTEKITIEDLSSLLTCPLPNNYLNQSKRLYITQFEKWFQKRSELLK